MELKPGYKRTEVGVIPEDWKAESVQSIGDIRTGPFGTLLKASEYSTGEGTPLISVREIGEGMLRVDENTPLVPASVVRRLPQYVLSSGDIVFGRKGAVDRSALVTETQSGWFLGSDGIRIRLFNSVHSPFVAYQLQRKQIQYWLLQNATGTTMASLNQEILRRISLPLPPLPEQRAIAAALSDVDELIASLDKLIAKKRDIKQAAMQQLLTGKTRLPGFDEKPRFKDTDAGLIPEDWKARKLGEIATCVASGRSTGNTVAGSYPLYGSTGIIGYSQTGDYEGDAVLVARVGANAGKLNYVVGRYSVTDNTIIIRLGDGFCLKFFWYFLESKRLNNLVFGSGQPLITGTQLKNVCVSVPTQPEQRAITSVLSDMDAEIAALYSRRDKTILLKQGMMQELLTGRIRLV